MSKARLFGAVFVAGALIFTPRCLRFQPGVCTLPNVILIVLDTLRADRTGTYGNHRSLTPFLTRWAAASIVYERAYAPSSWTIPSIASLFLARYPSEHRVIAWRAALPQRALTLAEILQQHGFHTAGFSANPQIAASNGFNQGFETFQLLSKPEFRAGDARQLSRAALRWLDHISRVSRVRRPFFLYLQYMEPHFPYHFHPGVTPKHPADLKATDADLNGRLQNGAVAISLGASHPWSFDPLEVQRLSVLYDGEVSYLDSRLARLFAQLARRDRLRDTLVIITADHGEEFGEHGVFLHGNSLFEPAIHVPLIIRLPGEPRPRRVATLVGLTGLAPALLRQLGIHPPPVFHTTALAIGERVGTPGAGGYAHSELIRTQAKTFRLHRHALLSGTHKLLILQSGEHDYYDLAWDPGETRPLVKPSFAGQLELTLARVTNSMRKPASQELVPIDSAARERLRSLGYAQ